MTAGPLWLVLPASVDDPERVSGGNVFDLRVRDGLEALGWEVRTVKADAAAPGSALAQVPDGGLVLIDGLVAVSAPDAVEAASERLRIVALALMSVAAFPGAGQEEVDDETRALRRALRVIVPSAWVADELVGRGATVPSRVVIAEPGADDAPLAEGTADGGSLLCVGVVAGHKGHDTLVDALSDLAATPGWSCTIAGSVSADPGFASSVAERGERAGISDRIRWAGVLEGDALQSAYRRADLLVAPSRTESYGIAVGDALRRGIPVIASHVGGLPEAVRPAEAGLLVPPDDPAALAGALERWMTDPALRSRMRRAARAAAPQRPAWSDTALAIDRALKALL